MRWFLRYSYIWTLSLPPASSISSGQSYMFECGPGGDCGNGKRMEGEAVELTGRAREWLTVSGVSL